MAASLVVSSPLAAIRAAQGPIITQLAKERGVLDPSGNTIKTNAQARALLTNRILPHGRDILSQLASQVAAAPESTTHKLLKQCFSADFDKGLASKPQDLAKAVLELCEIDVRESQAHVSDSFTTLLALAILSDAKAIVSVRIAMAKSMLALAGRADKAKQLPGSKCGGDIEDIALVPCTTCDGKDTCASQVGKLPS
jgi:hypothetical protein